MEPSTPPDIPESPGSGEGASPVLRWALVLLAALFVFKFWAIWQGERAPTDVWLETAGRTAGEAAEDSVGVIASLRYLFGLPSLVNENRRLERLNGELRARLDNLQGLRRENRSLRQALELDLPGELEFSAAEVQSRNTDEFFSRMTVNRGSAAGVESGNLVLSTGGAVVGEVIETADDWSRVRLVVHPNFAVGAVTADHDASGVLVGDPPRGMQLQFLAPDSPIEVNDKLYTSGISGEVTRGLYLGRVTGVVKQPELERIEVRVEPAARLNLLEHVLVVTGE